MHKLIVSPFLDGFLAVHPGNAAGIRLPESCYGELRSLTGTKSLCPPWLINTAREAWELDLGQESANDALLVREPSEYGFGRASWETNLGCNFACKHCYLGLKEFSGLSWVQKVKLLDIMRDSGVLWLQITGGEPTIDRHFQDAYRYAASLGMMLTVSTNASRLWESSLLAMFEQHPAYRIVVSVYGATEASFDGLTQRRGAWNNFQRGIVRRPRGGTSRPLEYRGDGGQRRRG